MIYGDKSYDFVLQKHDQRSPDRLTQKLTTRMIPRRVGVEKEDPMDHLLSHYYMIKGTKFPFVFPTPYLFNRQVWRTQTKAPASVWPPVDDLRYHRYEGRHRSNITRSVLRDNRKNPVDPDIIATKAYVSAINGLYEYDLNVLMTVLGLGDTFSMVSKAIRDLFALKRALQRGRLKDAAKIAGISTAGKKYVNLATARDLSSRHLEFKFGWQQMASDISSGMEILSRQESMPLVSSTGWSVGYEKYDEVWDGTDLWFFQDQPFPWAPATGVHFKNTTSDDVKSLFRNTYEAKVHVRHRRDYIVDVAALHSLGILRSTDLALVAWDALPFSFLVDMFIAPVSRYIQALTIPAGLRCVAVSETRTDELYQSCQEPMLTSKAAVSQPGNYNYPPHLRGKVVQPGDVSHIDLRTYAHKSMNRTVSFSKDPTDDLNDHLKPEYTDMFKALMYDALRRAPTFGKLLTALEVGAVISK